MIYAPIMIPTLNRFDHFRQCLESLEACSGADKTEVYIGLDYPPSEKYVDGWKKIDAYLKEKGKKNEFFKLIVYRRETNCGVGNPNSNIIHLRNSVEAISDCYILSEDDNIFSSNFLEFINKGLEKYKDDTSICAINGYCHNSIYEFKYNDNNYFFHNTDFSAWGCGFWVEKRKKMFSDVCDNDFFGKNFKWKTALEIYRNHGTYRCTQYFAASFNYGWIRMHDGMVSVYMQTKGMNVVVPTISKVRNIGWDNQGQSFVKGINHKYQAQGAEHAKQLIDSEPHFEFEGNPWNYYDVNNRISAEKNVNNQSFVYLVKDVALIIVKYYVKRIIGYKKKF